MFSSEKEQIFLCCSSLFLFVLDFPLAVQSGLSVLIDTSSGTFPRQMMTLAPVLLIFPYESSLSLLNKITVLPVTQVLAISALCALSCKKYPNTATLSIRVLELLLLSTQPCLSSHTTLINAGCFSFTPLTHQLFSTLLLPQLLQRSDLLIFFSHFPFWIFPLYSVQVVPLYLKDFSQVSYYFSHLFMFLLPLCLPVSCFRNVFGFCQSLHCSLTTEGVVFTGCFFHGCVLFV